MNKAFYLMLLLALSLMSHGAALAQQNAGYGYQGYGHYNTGSNPNPAQPGQIRYSMPMMGSYPMMNQPGWGYYNAAPRLPGAPVMTYGTPVSRVGGFYSFGNAAGGFNYWRAPSGYYYPWAYNGVVPVGVPPVLIVQQGQTVPTQPSISSVMKDLRSYLDEQKSKGKIAEADYIRSSRRLNDIMSKDATMRTTSGGTLDSIDEENIRRDLTMLSSEISRRIKP